MRGGKPTATAPETIAGMKFYKSLWDANISPKGLIGMQHRDLLTQGKMGMYIDGPWNFQQIKELNPDLYPHMGAALNPWENHAATGGAHHFLTVPKDAKNKDAASKFIEFWSREEWQRNVFTYTSMVPGRMNVMPEEALQEMPYMNAYIEGQKYAIPVAPEGLEKYAAEVMHEVVNSLGKILFFEATVESEMEQLQKKIAEISAR